MKIAHFALGLILFLTSAVTQAHPLTPLLLLTRATISAGRLPVFIFDLDETLVDSTKRKLMSYKAALPALQVEFPAHVKRAQSMELRYFYREDNVYDTTSILAKLGVKNLRFREKLDKIGLDLYLSNTFMSEDTDIPGAIQFIRYLRIARSRIFFVSSRWQGRQGSGTLASLRKLGFLNSPGDSANVLLRPEGMSSLDFKKQSFDRIRKFVDDARGAAAVVGVFENEPENMDAMVDRFPEALPYFVDGACIKCQPLVSRPIHLKDFLLKSRSEECLTTVHLTIC